MSGVDVSSADVLAVIEMVGPVTTPDIAATLGADPRRLSASIWIWYRDAVGRWAFVQRKRAGSGFAYRIDLTAPARSPGEQSSAAVAKKPAVKTAAPAAVASVDSGRDDKLAALVLWDVDDVVVLLDANGGVIRGRRLR